MSIRGPMSQPYQAFVMLVLTLIWGSSAIQVLGYSMVSPGLKAALFVAVAIFVALGLQGFHPILTHLNPEHVTYRTMGTRSRDIPVGDVWALDEDGNEIWLRLKSGERLLLARNLAPEMVNQIRVHLNV